MIDISIFWECGRYLSQFDCFRTDSLLTVGAVSLKVSIASLIMISYVFRNLWSQLINHNVLRSSASHLFNYCHFLSRCFNPATCLFFEKAITDASIFFSNWDRLMVFDLIFPLKTQKEPNRGQQSNHDIESNCTLRWTSRSTFCVWIFSSYVGEYLKCSHQVGISKYVGNAYQAIKLVALDNLFF